MKKPNKRVLDVCCGAKMFYFDKNNSDVEFCDIRQVPRHEFYPNRYIEISPDTICDFTALPFDDKSFKLVIFDPPHLTKCGENSWLKLKYGRLEGDWQTMIQKGFMECFRVLDDDGILIFKWSEIQIPLKDILPLSPYTPLLGQRTGKQMNTHWMVFMKPKNHKNERSE